MVFEMLVVRSASLALSHFTVKINVLQLYLSYNWYLYLDLCYSNEKKEKEAKPWPKEMLNLNLKMIRNPSPEKWLNLK